MVNYIVNCIVSNKLIIRRAVGGMVKKVGDFKTAQKINVEYPLALAELFVSHAALSTKDGKKLRFVFTSGALTERDMNKTLWFLSESRKMKVGSMLGLNLACADTT